MNSERQYIELYGQTKQFIDNGSHALINAHRQQALEQLEAQGLPTSKNERYKYIDVAEAFAPDYGLNLRRMKMEADPGAAYRCSVPNLDSVLYYVFNDKVVAKDGNTLDTDRLFVGSLVDFAANRPEEFNKYYNKFVGDGLVALNTLLAQDGVVVWIGDGYKCEKTIQILNLTLGNVAMMTNRRVLIVVGKGAEASLLVCDHSLTKESHLVSEVVEIVVGEDAVLHLCSIEETGETNKMFRSTNIVQHCRSKLSYTDVTLNNGLTRHTLDLHLAGEKAEACVSGLVVGGGTQHADSDLLISHEACCCKSDVLYKSVLDGSSTGSFAGKVYVAPGAQKSESQETNSNLCVSPNAHAYTRPMLEIYADDVKCNHGSTVGRLDESALFYMAQRGVDPTEGRRLLQQAFACEVIERIELPSLRTRLHQMIEERFRRGSGACGDCVLCASK